MSKDWEVITKAIKARVQTMIWGPPGIGKSARIEQFCEETGMRCHIVTMAGRDPGDLPGYMVPEPEKRRAILLPAVWVREILDDDKHHHVVFLDEWNNAAPATQAAALTLIQSGIVGDIRIPMQRVSFVAACNPAEYAANAMDLSAAMANRWAHFHVRADFADWASWLMLQTGLRPQVSSTIMGFLRKFPHHFFNLPKDGVSASGAWPSPRSWFNAIRMCSDTDDLPAAIEATCGEGVALEFITFAKDFDMPDPEQLLLGQVGLPTRADKLFAALTSVVSVTVNKPTEDRWHKLWKVLEKAYTTDGAKDIAVIAMQSARKIVKVDNSINPGEGVKRFRLPSGDLVALPMVTARAVDMLRDAGMLS